MAGPERRHDYQLIRALATQGRTFNFFQAVQLLHRLYPKATAVGELGPAENEAIRFHHDPELVFHAGDIVDITVGDKSPAHITTAFLGLFGSVSPLATAFAEDVLFAENEGEHSLRGFYDIFHHRAISLMYRAWKKYRFEAGFRSDGGDLFTKRAMSFVGVDAAAPPSRGLTPLEMLALAPLLSQRTRPVRSLRVVLERMFPGKEIGIESFVERRVILAESNRTQVGKNCYLGLAFVAGAAIVDRSGRFRVSIGPVDYETYERLMPGGRDHVRLRAVIEQFTRGEIEAELELLMHEDASIRFQLGSERGGILGVSTRVGGKPRRMRARVLLSENLDEVKSVLMSESEDDASDAAAAHLTIKELTPSPT